MRNFTDDVLIIGLGLAGSVLVEHLRERGCNVHVFDTAQDGSASRAAAGVVNPISLRRDVLTWRAPEMLATARQAYRSFEDQHCASIWHPLQLIKIFPTPAEAIQWERAKAREGTSTFLGSGPAPELDVNGIPAPHGHGIVQHCAWLDMATMLTAQRSRLIREGAISTTSIAPGDIHDIPGGIRIKDRIAPLLIYCNGPFGMANGLVPVKGEVLTVRIPELKLTNMIHRGIFILPIGDHLFRIGSTYKWNEVWEGPTNDAREDLFTRLKALIHYPVKLIEHRAGVRPASRDRRPILGRITPHRAIFNGLGSRGVMLAPWCARHLVAHLFDGSSLDPEVDIQRFSSH